MRKYVCTLDEVLDEYNMIFENFDTAIEKFASEPFVEEEDARRYVEEFKKYRVSKPKALFDEIPGVNVPANQCQDILAYKTFKELKKVIDHVDQNVQNKEKKAKKITQEE